MEQLSGDNIDFNKGKSILSPWKSRTAEEILAFVEFNKLMRHKLSWGIEQIDQKLGGGLLSGLIYEISGEAGSGKTQIALTLTAQFLLSQLNLSEELGYVYYISTGGNFPVKRLQQIIEKKLATNFHEHPSVNKLQDLSKKLMHNVFIEIMYTDEELYSILDKKIPHLIRNYHIRMIILDSITKPFRLTEDLNNRKITLRSSLLFAMSSVIKRIAYENHIWFLITNEVSETIQLNFLNPKVSKHHVKPSLGLVWANCIDIRLFLTKSINTGMHKMEVNFSPYTTTSYDQIFFRISQDGINIISNL